VKGGGPTAREGPGEAPVAPAGGGEQAGATGA